MQIIDICKEFPDAVKVIVVTDSRSKEIIGFATCILNWRSLIINIIITQHKHLRKGVGCALFKKIIEIGDIHPKDNVVQINTVDLMLYAQKFYLANGFKISGYVTHFLGWYNNQIIYTPPLKKVSK
ncbi:MAG: GNAT family N-acetyltransferase [Candidatus Thorarchaeota archaeon]